MTDPGSKQVESITEGTSPSRAIILQTYLRQRFNFVTFGVLTLYLILFAKEELHFQPSDAMTFIVVLLFLLTMRLYDDLQNARYDREKPDRIYTELVPAKKLYTFFVVFALLVSCLLLFLHPASGALLPIFLLVNHSLYVLLVNRSSWRHFLPLLKYPFIIFLINGYGSAAGFSLFFAFLTFDLIDDPDFPPPRWSTVITSLLALALLMPSVDTSQYITFGALAILTVAVTLIRNRYTSYAFLVAFLLVKLIAPLYEI